MRSWYLHDPEQQCSVAILQELGLHVGPSTNDFFPGLGLSSIETLELSPNHLGQTFKATMQELRREHRYEDGSAGLSGLVIKEGSLYVDLRDTADEWVRLCLSKGDALAIPPSIFRRLSLLDDQYVLLERWGTPEGEGKKAGQLLPQVKAYRFSCEGDEKAYGEHGALVNGQEDVKQLIVDLCSQFYDLGWVQGTGGSISIRHGNRVFMTPSGVQKERILPEEIYVLDMAGNQLFIPEQRPGRSKLKLTACAPLFFHSYRIRDAGAVIHSHGMECVLATLLFEGQKEFRITHQEMIKGIVGHGYLSELVVPIIENTPHEEDLADSLGEAIRQYPKATAVLVRRHGIYVWGSTWMQAKTQAECYHYLFKLAVEMHRLGIDFTKVPEGVNGSVVANGPSVTMNGTMNGHHTCGCCGGEAVPKTSVSRLLASQPSGGVSRVLLDIEGTTTSISFVHDVLFPYAKDAVATHLRENITSEEVREDINRLREQAEIDIKAGEKDVPRIPSDGEASPEALVEAVVKNVQWLMSKDRKVTALKQLQGHIWRAGYSKGVLKGHVYSDVLPAFKRWTESGLKVSIYSSGSREAQRLLFGYSEAGDLRRYLSCYFDTTVGGKRQAESYTDIALSLGVSDPSEILFITDVAEEAIAALAAGYRVLLSIRPGNAPLPQGGQMLDKAPRITSFDQVDKYLA